MDWGLWWEAIRAFILAAASGTAGFCVGRAIEYTRMKKFRKVFGAGVREPSDLMISVPLWRALEGDRHIPRFLKSNDSFGSRAEFYGPSEMYNVDDMDAAAYLLNVIGNHFSEPVTYTNDTMRADWNGKTVIIIGSPAANYHAKYYMAKFLREASDSKIPSFVDIEEDNLTGARVGVRIPTEQNLRLSNESTDYGLVLRMPNAFASDGKYFVFLIAGIHASSTREAARLLNELWSDSFVGAGVKAIAFEMDYRLEGTGRIIYECR